MRQLVVFVLVAAVFPTLALAQQAQPAPQQQFVPFTVKEADAKQMRTWLDEQPMKFALPVLQWLDQMETREIARIRKEAADAKAAEEHNKQMQENEKANTPSGQ